MGSLGALGVLGWLGVAAAPSPSAPLPSTLRLQWRAPAECPDQAAVRANIAASLAALSGPTRALEVRAIVEATLVEDAWGYRLTLTITAAGTTVRRELRARDCGLLAQTTGLIVGLALDPAVDVGALAGSSEAQGDRTPRDWPPPPTTTDSAATGPEPPGELAPSPERARGETDPIPSDEQGATVVSPALVDVAVRLGGGLGAGLLPGVGGGLGLSAALVGSRWRAEGHASRWLARTASFDQEPGVGASLWAWSGGGRGCWTPGRRVEVPLCGGVELAQLRAAGFGAARPSPHRGVLWLRRDAGRVPARRVVRRAGGGPRQRRDR